MRFTLKHGLSVLTALWISSVLIGFAALTRYQMTPAPRAAAAADLPAACAPRTNSTRPTLIMVLHPQCPCSRASLYELTQLISRAPVPFTTRILFVAPDGAADDWIRGDLWRQAAAIPNAVVSIDGQGRQAVALGATASGEVLLYGPNNQLLFSGGITDGRGHQGDNPGLDEILSILNGAHPANRTAPIYGCALIEAAAASYKSGGV